MRTLILLPLALAAAGAGGCGPASGKTDKAEQTAFRVPQRDLTLQPVEGTGEDVASPVELMREAVERPAAHRPPHAAQRSAQRTSRQAARSHRPAAPGAAPAAPAPATTPAPVTVGSGTAMLVTNAVYEAPDPHALAPGQTVTVVPASNGASNGGSSGGPAWIDARQGDTGRGTDMRPGGHGGGCGARGGGRHPGAGVRGLR